MRNVAAALIGVAIALFATVSLQALLPGVLAGSLVVVADRLHAKRAIEGGLGVPGAVLAFLFALLLVAYALLITQQFLIGALAVAAFFAAAWLSGPADAGRDGPVGDAGGLTGN